MIIKNNNIILENNDLVEKFDFLEESRSIPTYVERSILKIVLHELHHKNIELEDIEGYLDLLPKDHVRKMVRVLNEMYKGIGKFNYQGKYLLYLLYYLPCNIYKIWKPLVDLLIRNQLKASVKILDIGTGPGSVPIGIIEFYKKLAKIYPADYFHVEIHMIDAEPAFLKIAKNMLINIMIDMPENLKITFSQKYLAIATGNYPIEKEKFDIITMSNFLNTNEIGNTYDPVTLIQHLKQYMCRDGSLVIVEPGSQKDCIAFKKIRNDIVNHKILHMFSPCIHIWECSEEYHCTCFTSGRMIWEKPLIIQYLHKHGLKKLRNKNHVAFNYGVFRKDNRKKYDKIHNKMNYSYLKELWETEEERVNICGVVRFVHEKKEQLFSICDGTINFSDKNVWISFDREAKERYKDLIRRGNIGEKIILKKAKIQNKTDKNIFIVADHETKMNLYY